jgi:hypothetical protein
MEQGRAGQCAQSLSICVCVCVYVCFDISVVNVLQY